MTDNNPWLLPEGIREVLPAEAARLEQLRRRLVDLYDTWGYELVMPPFIEYLESLLTGSGHDLDLQTFKLTDQLTGRMMGLRADMTPQVARIDAHHLRREVPVRLCYLGTVLHTRPDGFARSRSPMQVGAELYGHPGIEADAEVFCLMLETLALTEVGEIHVDLGHVGVFRGLARQAGLSKEQEQVLHATLQRKARTEVDSYLDSLGLSASQRHMLAALADLNGGIEVLAEARQMLADGSDEVKAAIDNLERIADAVSGHGVDVPLYFDLAELRGYAYHTGVVFAAFVPGHGEEIARGGRYDAIGRIFGRARPATGFSTDLKTLVSLGPTGTRPRGQAGILAPWSREPALLARVRQLRATGERVVYAFPDQSGAPADMGCDRELVQKGAIWEVTPASR